jgi:hypothetical protein
MKNIIGRKKKKKKKTPLYQSKLQTYGIPLPSFIQ